MSCEGDRVDFSGAAASVCGFLLNAVEISSGGLISVPFTTPLCKSAAVISHCFASEGAAAVEALTALMTPEAMLGASSIAIFLDAAWQGALAARIARELSLDVTYVSERFGIQNDLTAEDQAVAYAEPLWTPPSGAWGGESRTLSLCAGAMSLECDGVEAAMLECTAECLQRLKQLSSAWRDGARSALCSDAWAHRKRLGTDWPIVAKTIEAKSGLQTFTQLVLAREANLHHIPLRPDDGAALGVLLAMSSSLERLSVNSNSSSGSSLCGVVWNDAAVQREGEFTLRGWNALCRSLAGGRLQQLEVRVPLVRLLGQLG